MQDCCYLVERYESACDPYYERGVFLTTTSQSNSRPPSRDARFSSQCKHYKHYDATTSYNAPVHIQNCRKEYLTSQYNPPENFSNSIIQNSDCR